MRQVFMVLGLMLGWFAFAPSAFADKRVALLIGNSAYSAVEALSNPHSDVMLLKQTLLGAGFDDVKAVFDLRRGEFVKALRDFTDEANDADIAVIYYSGHGLEMGGVNYLAPVDARLESDLDVPDEAVTLDRVLQSLDGAKRLKLVILDACRTNPYIAKMRVRSAHRSIQKGLAPIEPSGPDTLVAFAARAGTPAEDGNGSNSPFAIALARRLVVPGVDVELALRAVRDDVLAATHNRQEPFKYGSLGGSPIPLAKAPPADGSAKQAAFDAAMTANSIEALNAFVADYPNGELARKAKSERERLEKLALDMAPPISKPSIVTCAATTQVSLSARKTAPLSANEECALQRGNAFKECSDCPTMVVIPAGSFLMGSPNNESGRQPNEGPQHSITIAAPFAVSILNVTTVEFGAFVKETNYDAGSDWRTATSGRAGVHSVAKVSWTDAKAYVSWLSAQTGATYRLLSESEWEYAVRGGRRSAYYWGDFPGRNNAVCDNCGSQWDKDSSAPVGSFAPNPFGLYDMHGSVWQWVEDCYQANAYSQPLNGGAPVESPNCARRVLRGGSWYNNPEVLRDAYRNWNSPTGRGYLLGIRVARTLRP